MCFVEKLNVAQRATPLVEVLNPHRRRRLCEVIFTIFVKEFHSVISFEVENKSKFYPQRVRLHLGALGGLVVRAEAHHARHDGAVAADVTESAATRTLLGPWAM